MRKTLIIGLVLLIIGCRGRPPMSQVASPLIPDGGWVLGEGVNIIGNKISCKSFPVPVPHKMSWRCPKTVTLDGKRMGMAIENPYNDTCLYVSVRVISGKLQTMEVTLYRPEANL
jgi:hypothetical protein